MFWLRGSIPYPFFIQITENMFTFLYAIFACKMPTPSLWIFFKDLSVFKITEKCSISYHFLFSMYCVVTQFSLRLSCNRNFGKYVSVVNLTYLAFPICLFESNWRNSHIWSPHSFIIFTVLDLKSPISLSIKNPKYKGFVIFTDPKTYFKFLI